MRDGYYAFARSVEDAEDSLGRAEAAKAMGVLTAAEVNAIRLSPFCTRWEMSKLGT